MKTINKIFKKYVVTSLIVIACIINPLKSAAQIDPCTDPLDPCPIDGGLSLLIAAGIGLAAKKAYDHKKQKQVSF